VDHTNEDPKARRRARLNGVVRGGYPPEKVSPPLRHFAGQSFRGLSGHLDQTQDVA